ncbi:MAG: MFS transporter [Candidatus Eisenbacteria bacterium]|nr:MFS transporter [Candidatus Eisenbacteria bacterium]
MQQTQHRRVIRAWCLYDWASSAFATTVMAALFPPFFRSLAIEAGLSEVQATAYWGYVTAFALLLVALLAPLLGAAADHRSRPKRFLSSFAALGVVSTAAFALIVRGDWRLAAALFILASVGFSGANVFYESLLPHIARREEIDRVSTRGYAIGYLGGGLLLTLNLLGVMRPHWFGLSGAESAVRLAFLSVALWWALFSIPLMRHVPEPPRVAALLPLETGSLRASLNRLAATYRDLRRYRPLALFLVAYWIYADGIATIVKMATAYGDEIGIGLAEMVGALVITQFVGIPCSLLFGRWAQRIGSRQAILGGLGVYVLISIGGFLMQTALHFYLLAFGVGLVQGGTQALSRSLFASMVPKGKSAEFFGFYTLSGRFAGIAGPLLFALIGQLAGSSRLGILAVVAFFLLGGALLLRVDIAAGRRAAGA